MAGIGETIVIRTDAAARIITFILFFLIAGGAYYPGDTSDWMWRFQAVLMGAGALYVLAFGWLQKIECTDSEITFRTPLQRRTFPFGEIQFAAFNTLNSLKHNPALQHLPKVLHRLTSLQGRGGPNPPVIVVKPHGTPDDAFVMNAKAFDMQECTKLFDKLAANGVRVDYFH